MEDVNAIYEETMNSRGEDIGKLLDILKQGMSHNDLSNCCFIFELAFSREDIYENILMSSSLIQRHMRDAQEALEEIFHVAQKKGYSDIIAIFEREYLVGRPQRVIPLPDQKTNEKK